MAVDWNGLVTQLVSPATEAYETSGKKLIIFGALAGLALIVVWRLLK